MSIYLSQQEDIVLSAVKEYLNKNRQFNIKKIKGFIVSRFRMASIDINANGIEAILKSLVNKKLIVEGSKLNHEDILQNQKRNEIFEYIKENPGTYFNKIVNGLKISNHEVVWHLSVLKKFGFIKKEEIENHEIYYDSNIESDKAKIHYFSSKQKTKVIFDYLRHNSNGITKTQLSADLKMHFYTISKYLDALVKNNLVYEERKSNKTLYYLNEVFVKKFL